MATMIFVEQENGNLAASMMAKDRVRLPSNSAKGLSSKGQNMFPGKVFSASENLPKPSRKALGTVNKQLAPNKIPQSGAVKGKTNLNHAKKSQVSERKVVAKPVKEAYPDIENFFPYNPSDFERFHVPEDHKLSHLCLAGVPLIVNDNDVARFEKLIQFQPSPMEIPTLSWESDPVNYLPFLATLDEITLDMPEIEC
ncbi:securin-like [Spea bombifrons]|uniref:securin-like n=1 Tax=Spea bombifrons TaxID=233779 RepID=UPI002349B3F6|nr:securin-like [Spea bombifrons]